MPLARSPRPRIFAVMFGEGDKQPEAVKRLEKAYPERYKLKDDLYLIKTPDLSQRVTIKVGIKGDDRIVSGAVFRLNNIYAGYYDVDLWDWLDEDDS